MTGTRTGAARYAPHVHVHTVGTRLSRKMHIPTGAVPLAAVVRFLIAELAVAPVRENWDAVLDDTREE